MRLIKDRFFPDILAKKRRLKIVFKPFLFFNQVLICLDFKLFSYFLTFSKKSINNTNI